MKNRLLELLQENCKYTEQELAILLNTTPDEVKRQIAYYEELGVICGYKALINWEKVPGSDVRALIELKVTPKRDKGFDEIAQRVMSFKEVEGVYLMAGDYDLAVFVNGHTIQDIAMFVAKRLSPLESVLSASTHFILTKYKSNMVDMQNLTSNNDERECVV
ncbi:MAG: Lrp/AsnC family transcriptional regulator [Acutalibacteraceae bacterium]|nr:Lrp/AsnC family transcriptional regulator [Clostridia bacterium]MEE3449210.1 Lrp/AsnC family transcriptional regulator [Acutalibacteraceae bacterium]